MQIYDLPEHNECEWLEFKQCFHDNNVKLLHDIICLANAKTDDKDRYLIFGLSDNKVRTGIENDVKRKTSSDIQYLLKNSNFNRIPQITLNYYVIKENHEIGVLKILNSHNKPYFLIKDKRGGKSPLRAGVVYTRIGDTNTPLDSTAPGDHIEQMWKEDRGVRSSHLTHNQKDYKLILWLDH